MSYITKMVLKDDYIISYYGCQEVGKIKATPELIEKYKEVVLK